MNDSEGMLGLYKDALNDIPSIDETNHHRETPTRDDRVKANDENPASEENDEENLESEARDEEKSLESVLLPHYHKEQTKIIYYQIQLKNGITIRFPSIAGSYQTMSLIGTGGLSVVAKLKMIDTNYLFAGKIYPIQDMIKNGTSETINQEVNFLSSYQHENIIKMYDSFVQKDNQNKEQMVI